MLTIGQFREINRAENYVVTMHSRRRLSERGILLRDVIHAVEHGEIIEQYPNDFPFPSCLILGITIDNQYLHVVISRDDEHIYLITAYYPDEEEWKADRKTRKER
jgi:hypothetical protein